jgi:hypothetical protein
MKIFLLVSSMLLFLLDMGFAIKTDYNYSRDYESYWDLAVKASTIEKKIEGIDLFVEALNKSNLQGKHNALFLETPNNGFNENFDALKSLQVRLHEIKEMDIKSFEYQTALAQITQQEQNEAHEMLAVFRGIWFLKNNLLFWGWVEFLQISAVCSLVGVAFVYVVSED